MRRVAEARLPQQATAAGTRLDEEPHEDPPDVAWRVQAQLSRITAEPLCQLEKSEYGWLAQPSFKSADVRAFDLRFQRPSQLARLSR